MPGPTNYSPAEALVHLWRAAIVVPRPFPVLPWYLFTHRFPPAQISLLGSERWDPSGTHLLRHAWTQQIIATWQHVRSALPTVSDAQAHSNAYTGSVQWRVFDAVRWFCLDESIVVTRCVSQIESIACTCGAQFSRSCLRNCWRGGVNSHKCRHYLFHPQV